MTKNEALNLVNESLIDQDTKFTREINALFNQKETIELLQKAYDLSDDNAKASLMDATEQQFLDKFAKDNGSGDDKEKKTDDDSEKDDDFLSDGSGLDDLDDEDGSDFEDDSSEDDGSEDDGSDEDFGTDDNQGNSSDNSNPFETSFGGDSNPFESRITKKSMKSLNESTKIQKRFLKKKHK